MPTSETQHRGTGTQTLPSNQGEKDYVEHFCLLLLDIVLKKQNKLNFKFKSISRIVFLFII